MRAEVAEAMPAALAELAGNPSSVHAAGRRARAAVENARAEVARLVGALRRGDRLHVGRHRGRQPGDPRTGAGAARPRARGGRRHVDLVAARAPGGAGRAGRARARRLRRDAASPSTAAGASTPDALRAALRPDTVLVTLALGQPRARQRLRRSRRWRAMAREAGALFHTDAVAGGRQGRRSTSRAGRRRADAVGAQARRAQGRGRALRPARGARSRRWPRAGTRSASAGRAPRTSPASSASASPPGSRAARARRATAARVAGAARSAGGAAAGDPGRARPRRRRARACPGRSTSAFAGAPGQLVAIGLDLEGDLRLDRRGLHVGLAGAVGGAARARPAARRRAAEAVRFGLGAGRTTRRRSTACVDVCRGRRRACAGRTGAPSHASRRPAGARRSDGGRDVGRRRFVDGGGAAGGARRTRSSA